MHRGKPWSQSQGDLLGRNVQCLTNEWTSRKLEGQVCYKITHITISSSGGGSLVLVGKEWTLCRTPLSPCKEDDRELGFAEQFNIARTVRGCYVRLRGAVQYC
ncbi:hypothetical protein RRG08_011682 [Elysia crispata]|uniref:Uncharacterized protein n=1 Tax=Elysia crispata TaxID=231223 RepID=A0AAE0ZRE9_9GAST|nr:hypothetical protein RRG08_011682 [Elysia crispata]